MKFRLAIKGLFKIFRISKKRGRKIASRIVFILLGIGLFWGLWKYIDSGLLASHIDALFGEGNGGKADFLRFLATVVAGILAFIALHYNAKRTKALDKQNEIAGKGKIDDRFKNAIEHLGSDSSTVVLGGIYSMHQIARDHEDYRKTVFEILCSYLREKTAGQILLSEMYEESRARFRTPIPIQTCIDLLFKYDDGEVHIYKGLQANLEGIRCPKADFFKAHLEGANLREAHLVGANLREAHLEGADLRKAHLEGAKLWGANLEGADLVLGHLEGADLRKAHLEGAKLWRTHLEGANLLAGNLERVNLREANLEGAFLIEAHLERANLVSAHLEGANLREANLEGALLIEAHLERANLREAHLEGANLVSAHLEGAYLVSAHLEGAYLVSAHLEGVNLREAHLEGANFDEAILTKADLTDATGANLAGAIVTDVIGYNP